LKYGRTRPGARRGYPCAGDQRVRRPSTPHTRSTFRVCTESGAFGGTNDMARSAKARMDRAGLTPRLAGMTVVHRQNSILLEDSWI